MPPPARRPLPVVLSVPGGAPSKLPDGLHKRLAYGKLAARLGRLLLETSPSSGGQVSPAPLAALEVVSATPRPNVRKGLALAVAPLVPRGHVIAARAQAGAFSAKLISDRLCESAAPLCENLADRMSTSQRAASAPPMPGNRPHVPPLNSMAEEGADSCSSGDSGSMADVQEASTTFPTSPKLPFSIPEVSGDEQAGDIRAKPRLPVNHRNWRARPSLDKLESCGFSSVDDRESSASVSPRESPRQSKQGNSEGASRIKLGANPREPSRNGELDHKSIARNDDPKDEGADVAQPKSEVSESSCQSPETKKQLPSSRSPSPDTMKQPPIARPPSTQSSRSPMTNVTALERMAEKHANAASTAQNSKAMARPTSVKSHRCEASPSRSRPQSRADDIERYAAVGAEKKHAPWLTVKDNEREVPFNQRQNPKQPPPEMPSWNHKPCHPRFLPRRPGEVATKESAYHASTAMGSTSPTPSLKDSWPAPSGRCATRSGGWKRRVPHSDKRCRSPTANFEEQSKLTPTIQMRQTHTPHHVRAANSRASVRKLEEETSAIASATSSCHVGLSFASGWLEPQGTLEATLMEGSSVSGDHSMLGGSAGMSVSSDAPPSDLFGRRAPAWPSAESRRARIPSWGSNMAAAGAGHKLSSRRASEPCTRSDTEWDIGEPPPLPIFKADDMSPAAVTSGLERRPPSYDPEFIFPRSPGSSRLLSSSSSSSRSVSPTTPAQKAVQDSQDESPRSISRAHEGTSPKAQHGVGNAPQRRRASRDIAIDPASRDGRAARPPTRMDDSPGSPGRPTSVNSRSRSATGDRNMAQC